VAALDLEIRAVSLEAGASRMLGDYATALQRLTWILTVAADPHRREDLARRDVTWQIANAHMDWVACARFLPEIPAVELFRVLDAGEAYLRAVGKPEWRAELLSERAQVLDTLGRREEAIAPAEEALALALRNPDAPVYTLGTYRWSLGNLLRGLGRTDQAEDHYRHVLADSSSGRYDRKAAHQRLAWCAIDRGEAAVARQDAETAVILAEGMGDDALTPALDVLTRACRDAGDRSGARRAAERRESDRAGVADRRDATYGRVRTTLNVRLNSASMGGVTFAGAR
jgi:tetratricopeptide (TPR) repeat protein